VHSGSTGILTHVKGQSHDRTGEAAGSKIADRAQIARSSKKGSFSTGAQAQPSGVIGVRSRKKPSPGEKRVSGETEKELAPIGGPAHGHLTRMTIERFEALTLWGRPGAARRALAAASAWATADESLMIGGYHVLESKEFVCIAFARDRQGRHRAYMRSQMLPSLRAVDLAITHDLGAELIRAGGTVEPDPLPDGVDLFSPIKGTKRYHSAFEMLRDGYNQRSARELIESLQPWFQDRDGNFAHDFQTSGYSARVWEIYLWAALAELGFDIDPSCSSPDF
jgi:hypothetical protein